MDKYGREEMVRDLMAEEGYTHATADRLVINMLNKIRENILAGTTLYIRGVGKLIPTIVAPREGNYFGQQKQYPEKFKLTLKVSRSLHLAHLASKKTQGDYDLQDLKDTFDVDEIKD